MKNWGCILVYKLYFSHFKCSLSQAKQNRGSMRILLLLKFGEDWTSHFHKHKYSHLLHLCYYCHLFTFFISNLHDCTFKNPENIQTTSYLQLFTEPNGRY